MPCFLAHGVSNQHQHMEEGLLSSRFALFPPRVPAEGLSSHTAPTNWLQQVLLVALPSVGSPHTRCPAWLPPPACLFTFILTRGIITIVCNISWKNESWAPCLPAAGDAATSSSSAAPRAASHSSHPPVQSRLLGRRGHRAALLPALTWAAGSRPSLIPHTHAQKALDGFQPKVLQRTPSPRRRRCSLSCDV